MRAGIAAVLLLLIAGCSTPGSKSNNDPVDPPVGSLTAFSPCRYTCFEPTIAVGPEGMLFVTGGSEAVWRGEPMGDAYGWTNVTPPGGADFSGDRIVDIAPSGRLFMSELAIGAAGSTGVRVVASDDNGTTWPIEHIFTNGVLGRSMDRQWVAFGPSNQVIVVYKNQFDGLYVHRSADGGVTFDDGMLVSVQSATGNGIGPVSAATPIIGGAPLMNAAGAILVPLFHLTSLQAPVPLGRGGGLAVLQLRPELPPVEFPVAIDGAQAQGDFFPRLIFAAGVYWIAWKDRAGGLNVANSANLLDWIRVAAPAHGKLSSSPWLAAAEDGALFLAWTETGPDGSRMMVANKPGAWMVTAVGPLYGDEARPGNSDFAHFALDGGTPVFPLALENATGIQVVRVLPASTA